MYRERIQGELRPEIIRQFGDSFFSAVEEGISPLGECSPRGYSRARTMDCDEDRDLNQPVCAIVVMAKQPEPGKVKTRLCPPLTPGQAADLYEAFLTRHRLSCFRN